MKCKDTKYRIVVLRDIIESGHSENIVHNNELPCFSKAPNVQFSENQLLLNNEISEWTPDQFHERLSVLNLNTIDDVEKYYSENFITLSGHCGVLLFLYTVLLTKVCI